MAVRTRAEPPGRLPDGHQELTVWGPPADVRRWIETNTRVEWVSRPRPHPDGIVVRARLREPRRPPAARQAPRWQPPAARPWWRDRRRVTLVALAAALVVALVAALVGVAVALFTAASAWTEANWPLVVAVAAVAFLAYRLLRRNGRPDASTTKRRNSR